MKISILSILVLILLSSGKTSDLPIFAKGVISTDHYEFGGTFSPDRKSFYFTLSGPNYYLNQFTIVFSRSVNGHWATPEVASFSGQYADRDPHISPDGNRLFFSSNRPTQDNGEVKRDFDLWYVDFEHGTWSIPIHMGSDVNSARHDLSPSISADGDLYFSSSRSDTRGLSDIYYCKFDGTMFGTPQNLGAQINSSNFESFPLISPSGNTLFFSSMGRDDGLGDFDIMISEKISGEWSTPKMVYTLNSEGMDFVSVYREEENKVWISSNRLGKRPKKLTTAKWFELDRQTGNGKGDIYFTTLQDL